ncbi:DUF7693 family protein [Pseudomonas sp. Z4-7]|uniref:DUF7693 family protein n=1 Tax=unclassified Pseudomonas TaxID=196821 RepID=UPI003DA85072
MRAPAGNGCREPSLGNPASCPSRITSKTSRAPLAIPINLYNDCVELNYREKCNSPDGRHLRFDLGNRFGTDPVALLTYGPAPTSRAWSVTPGLASSHSAQHL